MLSIKSPSEIASELALRLRARRLARGWSQAEMAERAGLKQGTYVLFERTGRVSYLRLIKILDVLGLVDEVDRIGRTEDLSQVSLDELIQPQRQRGRRRQS